METKRRRAERKVGREELDERMGEVCGSESHARRGASRCDGVDGVLQAARLGVRAIGHGLAVANGRAPRQALNQVDRLLSHPKPMRADGARCWVRFGVAERTALVVNCEWTAFEASAQSMLVLGTQTEHGRSPPLGWKTVARAALTDQRHAPADELLGLLTAVLPPGVRVTVVADRGFSAVQLHRFLKELGFASSSRFRRVVSGEAADGERRQAKDWLGAGGRRRLLRGARVTAAGQPVPVVVGVPPQQRQAPWRLARSRSDLTGTAITRRYGKRCTVEEPCRDVKSPRLGLGRKPTVMERNARREARFLLAVLAPTRRTRLGQAGEALGMDRWLGASRPRQYAHVRQGQMRFDLIPTMKRQRLRTLLQRFGPWLPEHVLLSHVMGYR
jgi:hypothetical protein